MLPNRPVFIENKVEGRQKMTTLEGLPAIVVCRATDNEASSRLAALDIAQASSIARQGWKFSHLLEAV